jgi:four helix bundle protein
MMGMSAKSFTDLIVWQKAHQLVLSVYPLTEGFPKSELFGLTSQMRRAAVSVPANIAEAFKKRGRPDKMRLLNVAQGSLEELRYYFILAQDLGLAQTDNHATKLDDVGRLLAGYIGGIERNSKNH